MIQIEELEYFPSIEWSKVSAGEFAEVPAVEQNQLLRYSVPRKLLSYNDKPMIAAGLFRANLLSTPYFWALTSREFEKAPASFLRVARRAVDWFAPHSTTYVKIDNLPAQRFAKFCGLENLGPADVPGYLLFRRG